MMNSDDDVESKEQAVVHMVTAEDQEIRSVIQHGWGKNPDDWYQDFNPICVDGDDDGEEEDMVMNAALPSPSFVSICPLSPLHRSSSSSSSLSSSSASPPPPPRSAPRRLVRPTPIRTQHNHTPTPPSSPNSASYLSGYLRPHSSLDDPLLPFSCFSGPLLAPPSPLPYSPLVPIPGSTTHSSTTPTPPSSPLPQITLDDLTNLQLVQICGYVDQKDWVSLRLCNHRFKKYVTCHRFALTRMQLRQRVAPKWVERLKPLIIGFSYRLPSHQLRGMIHAGMLDRTHSLSFSVSQDVALFDNCSLPLVTLIINPPLQINLTLAAPNLGVLLDQGPKPADILSLGGFLMNICSFTQLWSLCLMRHCIRPSGLVTLLTSLPRLVELGARLVEGANFLNNKNGALAVQGCKITSTELRSLTLSSTNDSIRIGNLWPLFAELGLQCQHFHHLVLLGKNLFGIETSGIDFADESMNNSDIYAVQVLSKIVTRIAVVDSSITRFALQQLLGHLKIQMLSIQVVCPSSLEVLRAYGGPITHLHVNIPTPTRKIGDRSITRRPYGGIIFPHLPLLSAFRYEGPGLWNPRSWLTKNDADDASQLVCPHLNVNDGWCSVNYLNEMKRIEWLCGHPRTVWGRVAFAS
jgi:hypothetical protein